MSIDVEPADLSNPVEAAALVEIIDSYARGEGGQNAPLTARARDRLVPGLRAHPLAQVLLAKLDGRPVGAAVCVFGFSTFAGEPTVNLHDFAVLPESRGRGVGQALLAELERRARERGCCRISLEVHDTNARAKKLYRQNGFGPWDSPTWFVTKSL